MTERDAFDEEYPELPPQRSTEPAAQRLRRLLAMVPWLTAHEGVAVEEVATALGVSRSVVEEDLSLLFLCGLPGKGPDDLIDVDFQDGHVYVHYPANITRPLRLTTDEAASLIVALRAMSDAGDAMPVEPVRSALVKLQQAAGGAAAAADRLVVDLAEPAETPVVAAARGALEAGRRVRLDYVVPSRDARSERDVDLLRIVAADGHWYLEGWCLRAHGVRLFRADRVVSLTMLDTRVETHPEVTPRGAGDDIFRPGPDTFEVTLRLAPAAAWVVDYHPVRDTQRHADGTTTTTLLVADLEWAVRLVMRLGGGATVMAPAEVRDEVYRRSAAALASYSTPGG